MCMCMHVCGYECVVSDPSSIAIAPGYLLTTLKYRRYHGRTPYYEENILLLHYQSSQRLIPGKVLKDSVFHWFFMAFGSTRRVLM